MSSRSEHARRWTESLAVGAAGVGQDAELRASLGCPDDVQDKEFSRALVRALCHHDLDSVSMSDCAMGDQRPLAPPEAPFAADTSFLGRLGQGTGQVSVQEVEDLRTLLAVLRGGTLRQRRAVVLQIALRLREGGNAAEDEALAVEALFQLRDEELAYEASLVKSALPRSVRREAKAEEDEWRKLAQDVEQRVHSFWDGEIDEEPIAALPSEQRAQLLSRVRGLSDVVLDHVAAVIEGRDGVSSPASRQTLLFSLRYAGDVRLVPSLVALVQGMHREMVIEAARALGRVDDPRSGAVLAKAYDRSVIDAERAVLAGALGNLGDARGAPYVRKLLKTDDLTTLLCALEALETLGSSEDTDTVTAFLRDDRAAVVSQAVRTLGRIADARALIPLEQHRYTSKVAAVWAEAEDSEAAIRSRLWLRGEEPPGPATASRALAAASAAILSAQRDPALVRIRSFRDFVLGHLWLALGGMDRAVARFEAAAARRPGWTAPLIAMGLSYARRNDDARALGAFRRALDIDRGKVEGHLIVMKALARSFLRRAEQVENEGRIDIARGLLDEVLALDLRRAPAAIRLELNRRHRNLTTRPSRILSIQPHAPHDPA